MGGHVSLLDWLTLMAWEFLTAVLIGMWIGRLRDRHLNRLAARILTRAPLSTRPPTVTELKPPAWMEDE